MEIMQDDLHKVEYRVWFSDSHRTLYLDTYMVWERKSKRHGWVVKASYHRLYDRYSTLTLAEVPFGDDIREMVKKEFMDSVTVKVWEDRK